MKKTIMFVVVAVIAAAAAFGGGYYVRGMSASAPRGGPGGTLASLTQAERERLRDMTPEQRQEFFKEKGIEVPAGAAVGSGAEAPRAAVRLLEGTVMSAAEEHVTLGLLAGGSVTVYVDADTVRAATKSAAPDPLTKGAEVIVLAESEAEGVTAAKVIVVR